MLGPKIEKRLHCHLTDRTVAFSLDPNRGAQLTHADPTGYDVGMHCEHQAECARREIKCQVYDGDGRFPFLDEEVLNLQTVVLNFRTLAQERLARFRQWTVPEMLQAVRGADGAVRREVAFYLRFRKEDPAELWPVVETLLDVDNRLHDHPARVETIESVGIWVAEVRAVPAAQFRGLLERMLAPGGPVERGAGAQFIAALREFLNSGSLPDAAPDGVGGA